MPSRARAPRIPRGLVWRLGLAVVVVVLALAAFAAGVDTSERRGMPSAGLLTQVYSALSLFVLGGVDLGVPTGGTPASRSLLWLAYFLAPVLTAGAVAEGLIRAWNPDRWQRRGLRDHLVIVGLGQVGGLYLDAVRRLEPKRRILAVDLRLDDPGRADGQVRHRVVPLQGDARTRAVRDAMRLDRSIGVILTTGNDLTNLEAATDVLQEHPELAGRVVAHVADVGLERTVARIRARGGHEEADGYRVFNAHRIAADELVSGRLIARFEETDSPDLVVIAGFGRFGQTILELLQEHAAGEFSAAVLVDRHAESLYRQFAERVGFRSGYRCDKLQADLADPGTWDRVRAIMEEPGHGTAPAKVSIVLGTDDDRLNIRTAMLLRQKLPDAQIVARCFVDSSLTRELSVDGEFEIFGVSRLLQDALAARHRRWFPS